MHNSTQAANPFGRKPVARMDHADIRRRFEMDEARLRLADWTDARLARIPDEASASLAFSLSRSLQLEFLRDRTQFLAYWRSLVSRKPSPLEKGDNTMTTAFTTDEQLARLIITEADAERLWNESPALQDEFESAKTLYCFARAIAEGHARVFTR